MCGSAGLHHPNSSNQTARPAHPHSTGLWGEEPEPGDRDPLRIIKPLLGLFSVFLGI